MDQRLTEFVRDCDHILRDTLDAGDCVAAVAPKMLSLAAAGGALLEASQKRSDDQAYARNALHVGDRDGVSLFALVWLPGQWTPVHDHGTWGVVGVLEGVLEERSFIPTDGRVDGTAGIDLEHGGIVLLSKGAVSTFVPNPDHIHMTGVPEGRDPAISLHLYGRLMNSFHVYDLSARTRRLVDVPHFENA